MVDDHLAQNDRRDDPDRWDDWGCDERSLSGFYKAREAPTLLIKPDKHIGMTRPIVDQLLRFAANPDDAEFDREEMFKPDSDPGLAWPVRGTPGEMPGSFDEEERGKWLEEQERIEHAKARAILAKR